MATAEHWARKRSAFTRARSLRSWHCQHVTAQAGRKYKLVHFPASHSALVTSPEVMPPPIVAVLPSELMTRLSR